VGRLSYLHRVLQAYVLGGNSQLTFWHETPAANDRAFTGALTQYYMTFEQKAHYPGPFDAEGVPLLDYHGKVGKQYNPIAVAQYALGNYNLAQRTREQCYCDRFLANADWLLHNLDATKHGTYLWPHHFDFEYFRPLVAPWYSGLAQGQGLSVLLRAYAMTGSDAYWETARRVFPSLATPIDEGGVQYTDEAGHIWIEEYLVDPPTHILNGFLWALWGVYDYHLLLGDQEAKALFDRYTETILSNLLKYDIGFWSLYELTPQRIKSIASPFYHRLHLVQLEVMYRLTGREMFADRGRRWKRYAERGSLRLTAKAYKAAFKLLYY
jgi:heparosan-N-sulfate-glucuronate 5-epimerase